MIRRSKGNHDNNFEDISIEKLECHFNEKCSYERTLKMSLFLMPDQKLHPSMIIAYPVMLTLHLQNICLRSTLKH